jgi:superfamily II DNA or RNA helicase
MNFHPLLRKKIKNWAGLEQRIEQLPTTKEKGDVFEQFVYIYLSLRKTLYQISELYPEKQIPLAIRKKLELERIDCGVDGLAILTNGKCLAYQAKFREKREKPSYQELSKFWAEARLADYQYTIANCYSLSRLVEKNRKHLSILVDEFDRLNEDFFDEFYRFVTESKVTKILLRPFKFQEEMISKVLKGFEQNDRGKLIAACGTGKTLVALWIAENMNAKKILFLAPSLALIKQTLEAWSSQSKKPFSYLCVCSDQSVVEEVDNGDIALTDLNVPVTTSPEPISEFLSAVGGDAKSIVFCTYQSLDVLAKAMRVSADFSFDFAVFDEAHRTAGTKISGLFSLGLDDKHVKVKRRLFMTATERLVRPWIIERAKEFDRTVFSMDDKKKYGPLFYRFNFGEAIKNKVISDYRIIVAGIKEEEVYQLIANNRLLVDIEKDNKEYYTYAQNIFRQTMLIKTMKEFLVKKVITFHSTIANAHAFVEGISGNDLNLGQVFRKLWPDLPKEGLYLDHINGGMSSGERKERLDMFEAADYGVVSNARCLTEGVDVPLVDSIYFVNPKSSLIDIVQACGRALRKPRNLPNKTAYFIVPILFPAGSNQREVINETAFETLHNLIQSLRDQDERLAEWVDKINLQASQGKTRDISKDSLPPIMLDLPKEFDLRQFAGELFLLISQVNGEPTRYSYKTKIYGKTERKSHLKRIFITIGDYSYESYRDNLVFPTLRKFKEKEQVLPIDKIKINHNNVSHTRRLGLIEKTGRLYRLTPLGRQLFEETVDFEKVFRRQVLRYSAVSSEEAKTRIMFPYRACLKILHEVKSINLVEFVFGLYILEDSSPAAVEQAIQDIRFIKERYPNIERLNEANKAKVLQELNKYFATTFRSKDIWEKKTTIYNQFVYFRNHLSLFDGFIEIDERKGSVKLIDGRENSTNAVLAKDEFIEETKNMKELEERYTEPFRTS